jgi:hypothetical protein
MSNWLQPIEMEVQLTKKDVLYLSYKSILNDFIIGLGTGALILGLIYYVSVTVEGRGKSIILLGMTGVILSVIGIIYLINIKAFSNEKIRELNTRYSFSQFAIEIEGAEGLSVLEWGSIYNLEETSRYFLIYRDKEAFYVIPKRYFNSDGELDDIRKLFVRHMDESKLELI